MPKKIVAQIEPAKQAVEPECIKISSMNIPINKIKGAIFIGNLASANAKTLPTGADTRDCEAEAREMVSKWFQLQWCPPGLNKT